jgi:hypothetical protein
MVLEVFPDTQRRTGRKSMDFPQCRRAIRAVEVEHRLASCPDDMEMRRAVVVRVDHHPQTVEAEDGWHWTD